jgi:GrpB-like predicted nucleotidyltransferase (UPF0157 family)
VAPLPLGTPIAASSLKDDARRQLRDRDYYLRDHDEAARDYEQFKHDRARRFTPDGPESREGYAIAKTTFVERITAIALSKGYPRVESIDLS